MFSRGPTAGMRRPNVSLRDQVDILRRRDTFLNKVEGFTPQCVEEAVTNETWDILLNPDRNLADRHHHFANPVQYGVSGLPAADHLDQRHEMGWIPEMGPCQDRASSAAAAHFRDTESAGRRDQDRFALDGLFEACQ